MGLCGARMSKCGHIRADFSGSTFLGTSVASLELCDGHVDRAGWQVEALLASEQETCCERESRTTALKPTRSFHSFLQEQEGRKNRPHNGVHLQDKGQSRRVLCGRGRCCLHSGFSALPEPLPTSSAESVRKEPCLPRTRDKVPKPAAKARHHKHELQPSGVGGGGRHNAHTSCSLTHRQCHPHIRTHQTGVPSRKQAVLGA
ncbi:hypothetical protein H8959_001708 [Pygathrix nigripes]